MKNYLGFYFLVVVFKQNRIALLKLAQLFAFTSSFSIMFVLVAMSRPTNASLSASTAQIIHGRAPEILETADQKIWDSIKFNILSEIGESYELTPNSDNTLYVAYSSTPSSFVVTADFSTLDANDINDDDEDYLASVNAFEVKNVVYEWKDANNNVIPTTSTDWLGGNICQSSYNGDSTLTINFTIQVNTEYGIPNSAEKVISKTFKVNANDGICYIQPGVLALNIRSGWPEGGNNAPAGSNSVNRSADPYNTQQFTRSKGFNAWAKNSSGETFPTTAFPEARFRIIPFGTISNYSYEMIKNPNSALSNEERSSNASSKSEFKFSGTVPSQNTDYVFLVKNNVTQAQFYYRFSLNNWVYVANDRGSRLTLAQAQQKCANNGDRLPTRSELSNSYYSYGDFSSISTYGKNNGYSRAIGEGVSAEWGKIFYYAPGDRNARDMMSDVTNLQRIFDYDYYFTSELSLATGSRNYRVGSAEGNVVIASGSAYTICIRY